MRWEKTGLFYGGFTTDVRQRHQQHKRSGGPLEMVYVPLDLRTGGGGGTSRGGATGAGTIGGAGNRARGGRGGGGGASTSGDGVGVGGGGGSGGDSAGGVGGGWYWQPIEGAAEVAEGEVIRRMEGRGLPLKSGRDRSKRKLHPAHRQR